MEKTAKNLQECFGGMQGWICPKCGRVYSPYTHMCPYCGPKHSHETVTTNLPYVPLEQQKSPSLICS